MQIGEFVQEVKDGIERYNSDYFNVVSDEVMTGLAKGPFDSVQNQLAFLASLDALYGTRVLSSNDSRKQRIGRHYPQSTPSQALLKYFSEVEGCLSSQAAELYKRGRIIFLKDNAGSHENQGEWSFVSKLCHFLNPPVFPIVDSHVVTFLRGQGGRGQWVESSALRESLGGLQDVLDGDGGNAALGRHYREFVHFVELLRGELVGHAAVLMEADKNAQGSYSRKCPDFRSRAFKMLDKYFWIKGGEK